MTTNQISLTQLIQQRWQASGELQLALPVQRLFTGSAPDETLRPYAVVQVTAQQPGVYSSCSQVDVYRCTLTLWAERLDLALQLAQQVEQTFHRKSFADTTPAPPGHTTKVPTVLLMQRTNRTQELQAGLWRLELEFQVWLSG